MTKSNSRVRRVKAWAIVGSTGNLIGYEQWGVYYGDGDAEDALANHRQQAKSASKWKVVPCAITYTLPTKPKH